MFPGNIGGGGCHSVKVGGQGKGPRGQGRERPTACSGPLTWVAPVHEGLREAQGGEEIGLGLQHSLHRVERGQSQDCRSGRAGRRGGEEKGGGQRAAAAGGALADPSQSQYRCRINVIGRGGNGLRSLSIDGASGMEKRGFGAPSTLRSASNFDEQRTGGDAGVEHQLPGGLGNLFVGGLGLGSHHRPRGGGARGETSGLDGDHFGDHCKFANLHKFVMCLAVCAKFVVWSRCWRAQKHFSIRYTSGN